MIKSVKIKNFQRYRTFTLEFTDGVNCLIGESDSGKTSVLNAIIWACLNQPSGDGMIRFGQDKVKVKVITHDHAITRSRGNGNVYLLDGKKYVSFGQNVPDDIAKALKLSAINIQAQHDGPFWFCDSAHKVSKELNQIVDLAVIDYALAASQKRKREVNLELEMTEKRRREAVATRSALEWVQSMSEQFDALETRQDAITEAVKKVNQLEESSKSLKEATSKFNALCEFVAYAEDLYENALKKLGLTNQINQLSNVLDTRNRITSRQKLPSISTLDYDSLLQTKAEVTRVVRILNELNDLKESLCEKEKSVTGLQGLIGVMEKCPTCGSDLSQKADECQL